MTWNAGTEGTFSASRPFSFIEAADTKVPLGPVEDHGDYGAEDELSVFLRTMVDTGVASKVTQWFDHLEARG